MAQDLTRADTRQMMLLARRVNAVDGQGVTVEIGDGVESVGRVQELAIGADGDLCAQESLAGARLCLGQGDGLFETNSEVGRGRGTTTGIASVGQVKDADSIVLLAQQVQVRRGRAELVDRSVSGSRPRRQVDGLDPRQAVTINRIHIQLVGTAQRHEEKLPRRVESRLVRVRQPLAVVDTRPFSVIADGERRLPSGTAVRQWEKRHRRPADIRRGEESPIRADIDMNPSFPGTTPRIDQSKPLFCFRRRRVARDHRPLKRK